LADENCTDLHAAGDPGIGYGAEIGRPKELRTGSQRDCQSERAADLGKHGRLQQTRDEAVVDEHTGSCEHGGHQRQ